MILKLYQAKCGLQKIFDMIEQLQKQSIYDSDGNWYGMGAPSNFELMEKINELVKEVNSLKRKLAEVSI